MSLYLLRADLFKRFVRKKDRLAESLKEIE